MSQNVSPVATLIVHRVADYEAWKKQFDAFRSAREEAGCLGHEVLRGVGDPNMIYVYCPARDEQKLRAHLEGTELAEAMQAAAQQVMASAEEGVPPVDSAGLHHEAAMAGIKKAQEEAQRQRMTR